ncbi:HypC/HybG/HupF family hydrogenase formation chaperone [Litorivivens sp.]|uniref:HypC/HybG/HupF family hydrogenase formation chaperone n=1 Tax=Litorivivens sp. TaxID=2020868 RepID=UPI003567EAB9
MCLGIPARISAITHAEHKLALVNVGGVSREVNLACVVEPDTPIADYIGCWVLVHVGFAMSIIDEQEAELTLTLLKQIGEADGAFSA